MTISEDDLTEFIDICKAEYGVTLPRGEAIIIAERLISLFELIQRPLPSELAARKAAAGASAPEASRTSPPVEGTSGPASPREF